MFTARRITSDSFEAVLFDGRNLTEIMSFVHPRHIVVEGGQMEIRRLITNGENEIGPLNVGDYVLRDSKGRIFVRPEEVFVNHYVNEAIENGKSVFYQL